MMTPQLKSATLDIYFNNKKMAVNSFIHDYPTLYDKRHVLRCNGVNNIKCGMQLHSSRKCQSNKYLLFIIDSSFLLPDGTKPLHQTVLTHLSLDKMAHISQTMISVAF